MDDESVGSVAVEPVGVDQGFHELACVPGVVDPGGYFLIGEPANVSGDRAFRGKVPDGLEDAFNLPVA